MVGFAVGVEKESFFLQEIDEHEPVEYEAGVALSECGVVDADDFVGQAGVFFFESFVKLFGNFFGVFLEAALDFSRDFGGGKSLFEVLVVEGDLLEEFVDFGSEGFFDAFDGFSRGFVGELPNFAGENAEVFGFDGGEGALEVVSDFSFGKRVAIKDLETRDLGKGPKLEVALGEGNEKNVRGGGLFPAYFFNELPPNFVKHAQK